MQSFQPAVALLLLALAGCGVQPFRSDTTPPAVPAERTSTSGPSGEAPALNSIPGDRAGELQPGIDAPSPVTLPTERPRARPATLGSASQSLVNQARTQRQKGDLPGATVSLERALRIEPRNPLLWIEMGRLRMDQGNPSQAEGMGRKALSMSVGDDATQSAAWALIADSLRARGKNSQAEEASQMATALAID
jgi:Tfp pilus assembly protein PilF